MVRAIWVVLADWTDRFNWGALEAIGTVGALWFAIIQATRAQRAERAKAVGILTTLVSLIEPITEAVPEFEDRPGGMLTQREIRYLLQAKPLLARAQEGLRTLSAADLASVGASEYVAALPLALAQVEDQMPKTLSPRIRAEDMNMASRYPAEACEFFRQQRDYLRHGRLGSRLRSWWRDRQIKRWSKQLEQDLARDDAEPGQGMGDQPAGD